MYGYLLLGVCAFVENVFPPIPGDTVTVFGGYLTGTGRLNFFGVVLSTTTGSFAGFMCMFALGKTLGEKFFLEGKGRLFSRENLIKVTGWFERFGYWVVLANRFLSGARSVISLCAGISSLQAWKVAVLGFVSCAVWNGMLIYAGYKVGENWGNILTLLKQYNTVMLSALAVLLVCWIIRKIGRTRANSR